MLSADFPLVFCRCYNIAVLPIEIARAVCYNDGKYTKARSSKVAGITCFPRGRLRMQVE